ncbi:MAG: YicC family protein [Azonexus sp.]|nr:YicC family protein [Betaproteobacteria bacterium]MBK8919267.1 YicC family protein [Betaproteobacteria bacterium]MBP6035197.1 YicC family protein [Azonexus sp.]MBP6905780.1 YicC family protein [Azonexus sp.]
MIYSMTGYAVKTRDVERGTLQLELKSVNSRFLDLHFRVAEELRFVEIPLRELFVSRLARGKLECRLAYNGSAGRGDQLLLKSDLVDTLADLSRRVRDRLPDAAPLTVSDVLRWPCIFGDQSVDFAAMAPQVLELAEAVLAEFTATRGREGAKLATMIAERVARMRDIVAAVGPRIPEAQALFTEKLKQRLHEALGASNDDRVLQEVAVFATRIDVAEELSRLIAHLDEVDRILKQGGACGKRLDFLMQELNREANTLGSKSALTEVSQAAMELKLLIEQMREQIQNLE